MNAQSGQHGASVFPAEGQTLGHFQHFLFEVVPADRRIDPHALSPKSTLSRAAGPAVDRGQHGRRANISTSRSRRLLARRCLDCHNPTDEKGGLDLTRAETAAAGGDSGVVLVPGETGWRVCCLER